MRAADLARVPGGHALTVDRIVFAEEITRVMESHPRIEVRREEVSRIESEGITIVATGPLTSDSLATEIGRLTGSSRLFFYDSISPIVEGDSIDTSIAFRASRYGKSLDGTDDYLNCPFDKAQYEHFLAELQAAQAVESHIPEDVPYFEACLPIEEIARRGPETLRFGQIHRNTYINAPALLTPTLQLRTHPRVLFAGQISGVEGYVESISTGLIAARHAIAVSRGETPRAFPRESALGSLCHYISHADPKHYQPANIAFDLFPPVEGFRHDKPARQGEICRRALEALAAYA
jgi:folate-dependent tRNA-U54 methylase TrmFO/GidA